METRNETIHEQGKLKRKLGLGAALAVAVGTTVGSGIFSSLAEVAGASGSALMMPLSLRPIPTGNIFTITSSTTPPHWTVPGNSGIFCYLGLRCSD